MHKSSKPQRLKNSGDIHQRWITSPQRPHFGVENDSNDFHLYCPCGCECVHPFSNSRVTAGQNSFQASSRVRGDVIRLPFWCEESCTFILTVGFHKGTTVVWVENHQPDSAGMTERGRPTVYSWPHSTATRLPQTASFYAFEQPDE